MAAAPLKRSLRRLLKDCPDPMSQEAVRLAASLLMAKIKATADALDEAVATATDPQEILIASARVGRDLREDITVLRQLQEHSTQVAASKVIAPQQYRVGLDPRMIHDGEEGLIVYDVPDYTPPE